MYQIKNVINYNQDVLDQAINKDAALFRKDKQIPLLNKRLKLIRLGPVAVSLLAVVFTSSGLVLSMLDRDIFSITMSLIGLGLIILNHFVLRPRLPNVGLKYARELQNALGTYFNSPAIKYHSFIHFHGAENVEIWGTETSDSKFEVTLSKKVNGELKQAVILFNYSELVPDGVLVLDVGNETVYKQLASL